MMGVRSQGSRESMARTDFGFLSEECGEPHRQPLVQGRVGPRGKVPGRTVMFIHSGVPYESRDLICE